jgi:hypothetical protein
LRKSHRLILVCLATLAAFNPLSAENPRGRGEGAVSHRIQPAAIVDGIRYERDELSRFDGQTLYWVYDEAARKQGTIYGFTTPEAAQAYGRQIGLLAADKAVRGNTCSFLHPAVNAGPGDPYDWLIVCPLQQISNMRDGYNDRLSYIEAGNNGYYTVLYECYNFNSNCRIVWVTPGATISDLNVANMNNLASSIRFCRNVDPFSCVQ